MISMERSLPVNPPGTKSPVSRAEVWKGLVLKADNALPFVPSMTHCEVLKRESENVFVREVEFRGDRMKERVTLEAEKSVTFERISGPVLGTIHNYIDEDESGALSLRFHFELEVGGVAAGSDAEKEYATTMEKVYVGAVDATLAAIRRLHDEEAKSSPADGAAPAWLAQFYSDVDNQRMTQFLDHFTRDGRVLFGNNPVAIGHEPIRAAIGGLWGAIEGLRHEFVHVWNHGTTTILEAKVTYFRKDGKNVTVPCVSLLETGEANKVSELRIHIDMTPVFA